MSSSSNHQPNVMIVSNEDGFTHLMRTLLEDVNLRVRCSAVAADAVALVDRMQPNLVILDLVPGQETPCWLLLEALRASQSTCSIPILLCPAARWLAEAHAHRLAMHDVDTWTNPFDLRDLLAKVQSALARGASPAASPSG
jgi:DNA-binding response OmpR family regulator